MRRDEDLDIPLSLNDRKVKTKRLVTWKRKNVLLIENLRTLATQLTDSLPPRQTYTNLHSDRFIDIVWLNAPHLARAIL